MNQKSITIKSAREAMGGVSQAFIYTAINSGELKSFKMGGRRLISVEAIDEYIRKQEQIEVDRIAGVA